MAYIGLDTQILIWGGIRNEPKDKMEQPEFTERSKWLLAQLERDGNEIVIPTIVAAELAVPLSSKKRGEFLAALSENFFVKPFDLYAAAIAADLFSKTMDLPKSRVAARRVLTADIKIIATVKAASASVFYTHDKRCRTVAKLILEARDLPTHAEELFDSIPQKDT